MIETCSLFRFLCEPAVRSEINPSRVMAKLQQAVEDTTMKTFKELTKITRSLKNEYVTEWIATGKKVVGYVCTYMPEEILFAAELFSVTTIPPSPVVMVLVA